MPTWHASVITLRERHQRHGDAYVHFVAFHERGDVRTDLLDDPRAVRAGDEGIRRDEGRELRIDDLPIDGVQRCRYDLHENVLGTRARDGCLADDPLARACGEIQGFLCSGHCAGLSGNAVGGTVVLKSSG